MRRSARRLPKPEQNRVKSRQSKVKVELKTKTEKKTNIRYKRLWPVELRRLAAVMRGGLATERAEEAAKLEAMAATLAEPSTDPRRGRPIAPALLVSWDGAEPVAMARAEAAEKLGVSYGTLIVMLSRGKGTWRTRTRVTRGRWIDVVVSRQKTEEN